MKKELGKWLLDISKYLVTGVLLTSIITDLEQWLIYVLAVGVSVICFGFGLYAIKVSDKEEQKIKHKGGKK